MKNEAEDSNEKPRLLFVDDEEILRITLSKILTGEGFNVSVASTVAEALKYITTERFDVLISDLNIGNPGDGLTVVSAMRRTQPTAITFILTGYPDFETALEAIRQQVDGYLTKPAQIKHLVETIKAKLKHPRHIRTAPSKCVATVIRENKNRIVDLWLMESKADKMLQGVTLSDKQRTDHVPLLLEGLIEGIESHLPEASTQTLEAAYKHGVQRRANRYTGPMIVREARVLQSILAKVIQESLLEIYLSTIIQDLIKLGEDLNAILEESIHAFESSHAHEPN